MSDLRPGGALPPPIPSTRVGIPPFPGGESPAPAESGRRTRRRRRIVVASAVGAGVLLLPFAGFLALEAATSEGGASSPEAAVQTMFDAIGDEDVLGVMDAMLPGERRSLGEPIRDIVEELRRLELLSEDADLGDVEGIDLEFEGLTYTTEEVADGIAVVEVTGGTVAGDVDVNELPLGDLLVDLGFGGERPTGTEQGSEPIDGGVRVATVEENDRWYVSLWFTVAEAARSAAGAAAPDPAAAIAPVGSDSPDGVIDELLAAAGRFDLAAVLAMLPPGEARALHVYAPLFLGDAQDALDELRAESGLALEVDASEYDVDLDGNRAMVVPTALSVTVDADGERASIAIDDGCATIEAGGERQELCADDVGEVVAEAGDADTDGPDTDGPDTDGPDAGDPGTGDPGTGDPDAGDAGPSTLDALEDLADLRIGLEVVEEDGRWYLSPTATVLRPLLAVLEELDADEIRDIVDGADDGLPLDLGDM